MLNVPCYCVPVLKTTAASAPLSRLTDHSYPFGRFSPASASGVYPAFGCFTKYQLSKLSALVGLLSTFVNATGAYGLISMTISEHPHSYSATGSNLEIGRAWPF